MTEPTTIRECWERVKARHERSHPDSDWCKHGCGTSPWPCLDYSAAVAALALLDNAIVFYCPECDEHFKQGDPPHAECDSVEAYYWARVDAS